MRGRRKAGRLSEQQNPLGPSCGSTVANRATLPFALIVFFSKLFFKIQIPSIYLFIYLSSSICLPVAHPLDI